ncbi:MAG TPA: hypothetical protein VHP14_23570 [Anaerolineales bacterium]|nr:hypothetical protein [Anaerolineales bacterium]
MNFNFGEVLSRAWQIIWKHKVLWVFGIFAGCSRGGNFNSSNNSGGNGGGFGNVNLPPQLEQFFQNVAENMTMYMVIAITLFCVIWLVMIFLGTIGRIGLIRGTWQIEGGVESLIFGELFSESMPYFWRIFGLSLLAALPILIVVVLAIVIMVPIVVASSGGGGGCGGSRSAWLHDAFLWLSLSADSGHDCDRTGRPSGRECYCPGRYGGYALHQPGLGSVP